MIGKHPLSYIQSNLTHFSFELVSELLMASKNICFKNSTIFPNCSLCNWDIKIGLPCINQLAKYTDVNELLQSIHTRWRKNTLFECYMQRWDKYALFANFWHISAYFSVFQK